MIFAEVKLKNGEIVRIPFICQRCGKCCRILSKVVFDPIERKLYMEDIDEISKYVNIDEVIEKISRYVNAKHPVKLPCPFFRDNECSIHPIRPRSCRIFPLGKDFDQGIGCPGLNRLKELISAFDVEKVEYKFVEGELPKVRVSRSVFERFLSLSPTDEEIGEFFKLNEI